MPVERLGWRPVTAWTALNAWMTRAVDVLVGSDRWDRVSVAVTGALVVTWPRTLVQANTTGAAVTLTLPRAADVVGFELAVKRVAGSNTLTVQRSGTDTIDGGTSHSGTAFRLVSDGVGWVLV